MNSASMETTKCASSPNLDGVHAGSRKNRLRLLVRGLRPDSRDRVVHATCSTRTRASKSTDIDANYSTAASPAFGDSIALSIDIDQGRFGLTTDLLYGFTGDENLYSANPT